MGYIKHDGITVTGWKDEHLKRARDKAVELGLIVTELQKEPGVNGYLSFLICPDGSKEGWEDSDEHENAREAWKDWVDEESSYQGLPTYAWDTVMFINWIHVRYGGDDEEMAFIVEHSGQRREKEE